MVTILCVRFGKKYGIDYVERLRNMVARHCTIPYEFVCLTDDATPIEGVRSIVQPNANYQKGWWHKVHMFDSELDIQGRILYFDLDIVINSNINKLVDYQDEFMGIRDFNRKFNPGWTWLNSSVMSWIHRNESYIWSMFKENPKNAMVLPGDQDWIWKVAQPRITFYPTEWILSYKWEIRNRDELVFDGKTRRFATVKDPIIPTECCVVVFHGDPKPEDIKDPFVVDNWL